MFPVEVVADHGSILQLPSLEHFQVVGHLVHQEFELVRFDADILACQIYNATSTYGGHEQVLVDHTLERGDVLFYIEIVTLVKERSLDLMIYARRAALPSADPLCLQQGIRQRNSSNDLAFESM